MVAWVQTEIGLFVSNYWPVTVGDKETFSLPEIPLLMTDKDGTVHLPSNALASAKLINASDKIADIPGKASLFLPSPGPQRKECT